MINRPTSMKRRDFLRIGSLGPLGLSWIDLLRSRVHANSLATHRAKACILLWLDGGPSHLETFDPKPDAPAEIRGPARSIATNVVGTRISEWLPRTAQLCDRLSIIRSMTSPLGEHGLANHYLLTGYKPSPALRYPSYGSVVSRLRSGPSTLPPYIAIPELPATSAGFLGATYEPFHTVNDPSKANFRIEDLDAYPGIDAARIERRRTYVDEIDLHASSAKSKAATSDSAFDQAYRLITSTEARQAFDIEREPSKIRERYGPRMFGQSCLLARRLIEHQVPFVTVYQKGWDTHNDLIVTLRDGFAGAKTGVGLVPTFDLGFSALIEDLHDRNLLDETLVIAMGEFGRTPKLNTQGGRDHWPRVFSVVVAGGGIRGGQIIGASDRMGESPLQDPVTPSDLARTLYTLLGIDPDFELATPDGRPIRVNQGGSIIPGLI
jgi:hypothetical protein